MMRSNLIVLIDNTSDRPDLHSQHGLSLWIETEDTAILVDTGQDASFLDNAAALGVDPHRANLLFVTHGHYDHTGGALALLAAGARPTVVAHPKAWEPRRSVREGETPRSIGIPWPRDLLATYGLDVLNAADSVELLPGVWNTGSIPNLTGTRPNPELQRTVGGNWEPDTFSDEHALVLRTVEGLVVVTGCCHTGLMNTLRAAQRVADTDDIYALVGGLHLHREPAAEVTALARSLETFGITHLWVNHCTGSAAFALLRERLGSRVLWAGTGFQAELPVVSTPGKLVR